MKETKETDCLELWKERPRKFETERKRHVFACLINWVVFYYAKWKELAEQNKRRTLYRTKV